MFNLDLKAKQKFPGERGEGRRAFQMQVKEPQPLEDVGVASVVGCENTATAHPGGQNETHTAAASAHPLGTDILAVQQPNRKKFTLSYVINISG